MMHSTLYDVLIIGAGLSGLLCAYRLQQAGIKTHIVEARPRSGGRIHTGFFNDSHGEFGGTWFGPLHRGVHKLLNEFHIPAEEQRGDGITIQQIHPSFPAQQFHQSAFEPGTKRVAKGSITLINSLRQALPEHSISMNWPVHRIDAASDPHGALYIHGPNEEIRRCKRVILAGPPKNILNHINFHPKLPDHWQAPAKQTATWMGHTGKCLCWFESPFWREHGMSGSGFFAGATVGEIHDVSPSDGHYGILMGFLNPTNLRPGRNERAYRSGKHPSVAFPSISIEDEDNKRSRQEQVLAQIEQIFPGANRQFLHYDDYLWFDDPLSQSPAPSEHPLPHDPHRARLFTEPLYNNRLFWASSETSAYYPGYLEGAVSAAERCVNDLRRQLMADSSRAP